MAGQAHRRSPTAEIVARLHVPWRLQQLYGIRLVCRHVDATKEYTHVLDVGLNNFTQIVVPRDAFSSGISRVSNHVTSIGAPRRRRHHPHWPSHQWLAKKLPVLELRAGTRARVVRLRGSAACRDYQCTAAKNDDGADSFRSQLRQSCGIFPIVLLQHGMMWSTSF